MRGITRSCLARGALAVAAGLLATGGGPASAQPVAGGICKPVSERTAEVGCWIVAHDPIGPIVQSEIYWHLDTYPTRAEAEASKGPHSTVVESLGKVWLLSIEKAGWRPTSGDRVAEIGPLPVKAGETYSVQYMEAIFEPGMTAPAHTHSGPEAWYTEAGETCLETPDGKHVGRAGGQYVDRARRAADASHRDRNHAAPLACAHPARVVEARDHLGQGLDPEGLVQELSASARPSAGQVLCAGSQATEKGYARFSRHAVVCDHQ